MRGLAEQVLALHVGIREVFILEERGGHFIVSEEAASRGAANSSGTINQLTADAMLAPQLILGAAGRFSKSPKSLRLVGLLYEQEGILFTYLNEDRLLAITTEPASFSEVMQLVNDALPGLVKQLDVGSRAVGAVKSVVEAGEIARTYVARASGCSRVSINEVSYRDTSRRWEVQGTYQSSRMSHSNEFELEVDGDEGAIVGFSSSSKSSLFLVLELAALLAALGLLAWLVYSNLLR